MNRDAWAELTYLRSFDLVSREFKQWHERTSSSERTEEIVASITQGIEYAKAAADASNAVQPLLTYYAILSVTRALILFLDGRSEASLKASHGLGIHNWVSVLKDPGMSLLDLEIKVQSGTFVELMNSTRNNVMVIQYSMQGGLSLISLRPAFGISNGDSLKLDDIVSREPKLVSTYKEIAQRIPNCFRGYLLENDKETIAVIQTSLYEPDLYRDRIIHKLQTDDRSTITFSPNHPVLQMPCHEFRVMHPLSKEDISSYPVPEGTDQYRSSIVLPWNNGGYMSPLLRSFIGAYYLGMLARYFPSRWIRLGQGRKGDALYLLLGRLLENIYDSYPALIRSELRHSDL